MERLFRNSYIFLNLCIFIIPLGLSAPQAALANPADDLETQCLAKVKKMMSRAKMKVLPNEGFELARQHCRKGNVDAATKIVKVAKCEREVNYYIKTNSLDIDKKIRERAIQICKNGDRLKAIEVVGGPSAKEREKPGKAPPMDIFRFYAEPSTIRAGVKSELYWEVYNADQITLTVCTLTCDNGSAVSARGPKIVTPNRTTTYTLKARTGDKIVEDHVKVHVSPFPRPKLSNPFKSVELCQKVDESGDSFRCISPDGPFYRGKKIHVILRFASLTKGKQRLHLIGFSKGVTGSNKWKENFKKSPIIANPKTGPIEASFEIPNSGPPMRKLELIIDRNQRTKSHTIFCVECPGHDEW